MWTIVEAIRIFAVCYALPLYSIKWPLPVALTNVVLNNPLISICVAFSLPMFVYVVAPTHSILRWATVPVIGALMISYLQTAESYIPNKTLIAMSSGPTTLVLAQTIDYLVLQRLHLALNGEERVIKPGSQLPTPNRTEDSTDPGQQRRFCLSDLKWGWDVVFNFRAVGTPREIKNMPKFSYKNPDYIPSRFAFLTKRSAAFIGTFFILDFLISQPQLDLRYFAVEKAGQFSGFGRLSVEDIVARFVTTAIFWFSLRLTIALVYNGFSIIVVALMIHKPKEWPPYFGSVLSAYSVRTFWA